MKKLTQDIFKGVPDWVKCAAIDSDGNLLVSMYPVEDIRPGRKSWFAITGDKDAFRVVGKGYWDCIADWQNSAIDREVAK